MIGIDTFSWGKLIKLYYMDEWKKQIEIIIKNIDWFITIEGRKEFEYFYSDNVELLNYGTILPILGTKITEYKDKGFDSNDASLLEYADDRGYRIITEDRPMILEGVTGKMNIIFLIDFFSELTEGYNYFSTRELYHLLKLFRNWRNIKEEKANAIGKRRINKK
jgi:hypothetical protein